MHFTNGLHQSTGEVKNGERQVLLPFLRNVYQDDRVALVCVLNNNKEPILLRCFLPCPSHIAFLADVAYCV